MPQSSSRVKLNRVALKDIAELKLVPRRRRASTPPNNVKDERKTPDEEPPVCGVLSATDGASVRSPLTGRMGPETVARHVPGGEQKERRRKRVSSCKEKEVKQEGPCTRGKYHQSKPNTRSRCRSDLLGKLNLRMSFTWCCCRGSQGVVVKPWLQISKMSYGAGPRREAAPAPRGAAKGREPPGLRSPVSAGKSPPARREFSRGLNRKRLVSRVAKSDRDRKGQSRGGSGSTGSDRRPAAAAETRPGSTGAPPVHSGLPNNKSTNPSLAGSEGSLRRAVGASSCSLCGDCKYICPQQKTPDKLHQKSSSPGSEKSTANIKKENPESSENTVVWINKYPNVTLCDIARYCDTCSHSCGFVIPNIFETNIVRCFKRDMRAGFRFAPGCLRHNKHNSEEPALTTDSKVVPRVQSEKIVSRRQSLTEYQTNVTTCAAAETVSGRDTCHFLEGWTSGASATCSASSLGKHTKKRERRTSMWERDVKERPDSGKICGDKRVRLGDSVNGSVPSTPDYNCKGGGKLDYKDKEITWSQTSDDTRSCLELAFDRCSSLDSALKPCGQIGEPTQTSSEVFCLSSEVDTDDPESFTCQRVKAYFRAIHFSCARTYVPWPFSNSGSTLATHTGTAACPADSTPSNQSVIPSDMFTNAPTEASSDTSHQTSFQSDERNGERHDNKSSYSSDSKSATEAEELLSSQLSDTPGLSTSRLHGRELSSTPYNVPESNNSMSTPEIATSECETATSFSPVSCPFAHGGLSSLPATQLSLPPSSFLWKESVELPDAHSAVASPMSPSLLQAVEKTLINLEETQMTSCSSSPRHNSDCSDLYESSLILPPDEQESKNDVFPDRSPPILQLYYKTSPFNLQFNIPQGHCEETQSNEFMLLPLLSPVSSPLRLSKTSPQPLSQGSSQKHDEKKDPRNCRLLPEHHMLQTGNSSCQTCEENLDHQRREEPCTEKLDGILSPLKIPSSVGVVGNSNEEDSWDETDCENDVEQGSLENKMNTNVPSGVLTEACSSPSSDEDDGGVFNNEAQPQLAREVRSSPSETDHESDRSEAAGDTEPRFLDEFTAYKQDILLVDVVQDDPELFENLPEQSLLKLGPTRVHEDPKTRAAGAPNTLLTPVNVKFQCDATDITEDGDSRPWRPQYGSIPSKMLNTPPAIDKQTRSMGRLDANNNYVCRGMERHQPIQTVQLYSSPQNIPPHTTVANGPRIVNLANMAEFWRQKSNAYCRKYFSESLSCGFKMCRFQHVPLNGDEKFCVETVIRFSKIPMCLQKAGAVFTGYYQNNPPGVYFSMPVLLSLLWALLKSNMVSDVFSVLTVSLAHKILPSHEFLLALFNLVRDKALMVFVPDLMQLTLKMASAGLVLNLDCLDCVKNSLEFQHTVRPASPASALPTSTPFPEYLSLAHSIVEIELCTKQEDWRRMGEVFRSICQFSQHPNQVERISGRIAIALLSESKDKLCLPFAAFAKTVCQNEDEDDLIRSFLGRIGVSLMLRYHKTHQWAKGQRVVEVLFLLKVSYSTLKGLFGNEDGASRCNLITVAAEFFLLSGSVEGALNTLRENKWFLSSSEWPCEPADLESRTRVLMRLAEKISHRDTLEVLSNLPGIKEPHDQRNVSRYVTLFNSHLQVCVDRHILPVASDTVDFMLSKNLAVDEKLLQILLHKLGKQNLWLCARKVFRHSLRVGYYPSVSAPGGFMSLIVPCRLGEVEMALTFEMFVTVNATSILQLSDSSTSSLSIILKRTQSCESEYLSAGSRLLSAASILQPKLTVRYTAVNASQEQVFTLDVPSARRWFHHNRLWANDVWMQ